jgi:P27 family predicted phage terminase small subunit
VVVNKAPTGLRHGGKTLWRQILDGWEVPDEQLQILENVCRSQDRIDTLQRTLEREGMTTKNRFGVIVAHPATNILRAEVANFSALYRLLQLAAPSGEDDGPGRRAGWSMEE